MIDDIPPMAWHAWARITGIPATTLAGLRDGTLVAVPREPTQAMLDAVQMACPEVVARYEWAAMITAAQENTP